MRLVRMVTGNPSSCLRLFASHYQKQSAILLGSTIGRQILLLLIYQQMTKF